MNLRFRLLILTSLVVGVTVALVTWIAAATTRRTFEALDDQRAAASVGQFRREFQRRGEEVASRVTGIAKAERTLQIAIALSRPDPDFSLYVDEASALAGIHSLDFLELVSNDGVIVSSAQWPAHFGYKSEWVTHAVDWNNQGFFLKREELPDETALALVAVRTVNAGDKRLYVVGGYRLGKEFLASLVLPAGVRVLLYRDFSPRFSEQALISGFPGTVTMADRISDLIDRVRAGGSEISQTISWQDGPETLHAIPLVGREKGLLGVLLVGSSRRELVTLINRLRLIGLVAGGIGILLGIAMSYWLSTRVTRPVERLVQGARAVAMGDWNARVPAGSKDEIGELASAFNAMTRQLIDQRDKLIQAERVAAWRELARRLAHELKNPLFPLQITIDNLRRAKEQAPEQFEDVFHESTETLLAQLSNLKSIIGRFSDFAKMPRPEMEQVDLNELVRQTMKLFDAQFRVPGRVPIVSALQLDDDLRPLEADPEQIRRVLQNLLLNAIDAMPKGGTATIRTQQLDGTVQLEVSDTGEGLTNEERQRLFTPYYTTKQHGTGLGLAIVQSVVSDHGARISVESEPGRGTTFRITFKSI
ncbi:MAG TPA: ATP-binding protein [Acidobacteriota bacterium]|nr:ATP-binding protein [Acidobacteriota bacterium]